ncbi:LysR family transcriptional regulator [Catenovulum sp. SM1970]|uniref:LysR family transcriptional regulator n=1 Tax=Marinifaba aquimaris TaxID=2741323 RepID=UPI0015734039|nr:LysR family transcriptional regulator [Marinifaba aquimaris]NTS76105.1 LysR family transcriptional regulator [Marinifaba aquimaris]
MLSNRQPTFRQLQLIRALAQYKNISAVAEKLHISQPSVSIQLKNLSELVELPIYHSRGKQIELTDAGQQLLRTADEIFSSLTNMQVALDDLKGLQSGSLKICVVSTAKYFLPLILGPFCKKHPKIDVNLQIGNRQQVMERLNANLDDFYIFSHCPERADIIAKPFLDNELVVVAPKRHELVGMDNISLARLSHYPFILREHGSGTRQSITQFLDSHKIKLSEKMTIESNEAIKYTVAAGLGLSILSRHTLDYGHVPGLVKLKVKGFPIKNQWHLVQRKDRQTSRLARAFEQFMQEQGIENLLSSNYQG